MLNSNSRRFKYTLVIAWVTIDYDNDLWHINHLTVIQTHWDQPAVLPFATIFGKNSPIIQF